MNKLTSTKIKGLAAILVVMTHVFTLFVSNNSFGGFVIPVGNSTLEVIIGKTADIGVYLFAFLTGFGLCLSYQNKDQSIFKSTIFRIIRFLLAYWAVVLLVFLPFYIASSPSTFDFLELVKTLFGHHGFFAYGWYIYFYLFVLITLPFFRKVLNINKWLSLGISFSFIIVYVILSFASKQMPYYDIISVMLFAYSVVSFGYTFAKFDLFKVINKIFKEKKWVVNLLFGGVGLLLTALVYGYFGKGIILPIGAILTIIALNNLLSLNSPQWINRSLCFIGNNSMNVWYLHYIFFAPFILQIININKIAFFNGCPAILSLIIVFAITIILSVPFYLLNKFLISKIKIKKELGDLNK